MKVAWFVRVIAILAVIALAVPAVAKPVTKNITIGQTAKFGGKEVSAGEYRLLIDGNKVTVQQGQEVVAEVEGNWEERDSKFDRTSVLIGSNGEVKEIRFGGEKRVLVLGN